MTGGVRRCLGAAWRSVISATSSYNSIDTDRPVCWHHMSVSSTLWVHDRLLREERREREREGINERESGRREKRSKGGKKRVAEMSCVRGNNNNFL